MLTSAFLEKVEATDNKNIKWVFATNRPETLDRAVKSRIAESIHVPLPSEKVCNILFRQYLTKYAEIHVVQQRPLCGSRGA